MHTAVLLAPLAATGWVPCAGSDWPTAAFLVTATAFYVAELAAMAHADRRARPPARRIDCLACRLALCSSLAVLVAFWIALLERSAGRLTTTWYQGFGAVVMLAGIALRHVAIRRLGERFVTSVSLEGRGKLIQQGVYARVRHPSETGLLLVALGAAVLLKSGGAAVVSCAVLLPLTLARISIEDRCLVEAFGGEFRSYRRRVRALVPFLF